MEVDSTAMEVDGAPHCAGGQVVRFALSGQEAFTVSKATLVSRASFFCPFADEPGDCEWGDRELMAVAASLGGGPAEALPAVLRALGAPAPEWGGLFRDCGLVRVFAAAHFLAAPELLEAARAWAAGDAWRLQSALSEICPTKDQGALRTALRYGLDAACASTLLHAAAAADAGPALRILLTEEDALGDAAAVAGGALSPLDLRDGAGRTALHICAVHDSAEAAALLIDASASLAALCDPAEEDDGASAPGLRTPLHLAAAHDSAEVVQLLLDRRADVASCVSGCPWAVTPLHECASSDAGRAARVLAAVAAAASLAPELWRELPPAAEEEPGVRWARFLDPLQAKVGALGETPLHRAAQEDAPSVVSALLEARADPDLGDEHGDTAVHTAVLYAAPRALAELLARGADPAAENGSGELPLHFLAEFGTGGWEGEVTEALVRRHFARSLRAQELLVEALRGRGQLGHAVAHVSPVTGDTALHAAAKWDHLGAEHAVGLLLAGGADLRRKNHDGHVPLEVAVRRHGSSGRVARALAAAVGALPGDVGAADSPVLPLEHSASLGA